MSRRATPCLGLLLALFAGAGLAQDNSGQEPPGCPDVWSLILAPGPQVSFIRDFIDVGDDRILVVHFQDLSGKFAKRYAHLRYVDGCIAEAVVLGSYAWSIAGDPPEGPRSFVLHHYTERQHATLETFEGEPTFEAVDALARAILVRDTKKE